MERNSFIFYKGWREAIKDLPDDVRLEIYESIIEYATTGNLRGLKPMANIAFNFIKIDIDRDTEKYMSIVERNKSNGSKGGRPKSENPKEPKEPTKPTGLFGNPKEPTKTDNDNEYDNDYVDDNDSHLIIYVVISCMAGMFFNVVGEPIFGYFYNSMILGAPEKAAATLASWNAITTSVNAVITVALASTIYLVIRPRLAGSGILVKLAPHK